MFRLLTFICSLLFSVFISQVTVAENEEKKWDCYDMKFFKTYADMDPRSYRSFVCEGTKYFETGLFEHAVKHYIKASNIAIHEIPNYALYPRIAHAYLLMGDVEKATHHIKISEMIIFLLTGVYFCDVDSNYYGNYFISDGSKEIRSSVTEEVGNIMCGAAYDYMYHGGSRTFGATLFEGKLAAYHLKVAKLIKAHSKLKNNTP